MIEIRCIDCGRLNRLADEVGGAQTKCAACGRTIEVPKSQVAKAIAPAAGIQVNDSGIGLPGLDASHPLPGDGVAFRLADARCRIWREGEMPSSTLPANPVPEASVTGLRVRLGATAKKKTLVHVQQAPWAVGDSIGVDLLAAAFGSPIRLHGRVARAVSLGIGKGTELDIELTGVDDDAALKLKMLEERPDLRAKVNKEML